LFDAETLFRLIAEMKVAAAASKSGARSRAMVQNINAKPGSVFAKNVFAQSRSVP
jgi:hypothetical protein